jgi:hypothetical protein
MMAAGGKEIAAHKAELENVLTKIMWAHTERCRKEGSPCQWVEGSMDGILCDLEAILERYHRRLEAA